MNPSPKTAHDPDPNAPTYSLADVETRAAQSRTMVIPTREERVTIPAGHNACLVFLDLQDATRQDAAEPMWVRVDARVVDSNGRVTCVGTLDWNPQYVDVRKGDEVRFGPEHVRRIAPPLPDDDE